MLMVFNFPDRRLLRVFESWFSYSFDCRGVHHPPVAGQYSFNHRIVRQWAAARRAGHRTISLSASGRSLRMLDLCIGIIWIVILAQGQSTRGFLIAFAFAETLQ